MNTLARHFRHPRALALVVLLGALGCYPGDPYCEVVFVGECATPPLGVPIEEPCPLVAEVQPDGTVIIQHVCPGEVPPPPSSSLE